MGTVESETIRFAIRDLSDASADVRADAARQLGKLRAHNAVVPLIAKLEDDSWMVRMRAVEALGRIGPPHALKAKDPIRELLNDPHDNVAAQARVALGALGDEPEV